MKKVIGVFSSKGGVGKTTIALNLALAMHQLGEDVILLDCDFKNSNLALHLGLYDFPLTVQDALESDVNFLESVHVHSSGLKIIPASISLREFTMNVDRLKEVFRDLKRYVVLDTPPRMMDDVAELKRLSDEIIVVTNPDVPSFVDSLKTIQLAKDLGKKVMGMVVNRSMGKHELSVKDMEKVSGIPILGVVPEDVNIKKSLHYKTPVIEYRPYSHSSIAIKKIAARVIDKPYSPPKFLRVRRFFY